MKKLTLLFITITISGFSFAQINFEKGYYITENDTRVECLIKNIDWRDNPTEFIAKLSENSKSKTLTIKEVKEFGVYDFSKYIKRTVALDKSSDKLNELSDTRAPQFVTETLFLKVLIEGKASLYKHINDDINRYFYSKDNSKIEQLVFKSYLSASNKIGVNNYYKQQLLNSLDCNKLTPKKLKFVDYKEKDISRLITNYNNCSNGESKNFKPKNKKDLINLNIRPGVNFSSFEFNRFSGFNSLLNNTEEFDQSTHFRIGLEGEFIFNFNKNKWAIIIEPTYLSYEADNNLEGRERVAVDYSSLEVPIGMRHYFYLNNNYKLFINASYVFNFDLDNVITERRLELEGASDNNFAIGAGFKYRNFSVEVRQYTKRDLLVNFVSKSGRYSNLSVIFGYSFL